MDDLKEKGPADPVDLRGSRFADGVNLGVLMILPSWIGGRLRSTSGRNLGADLVRHLHP